MDRTKTKKVHSYKKIISLAVAFTLLSGFCACMGQKEEPLTYISHEELMGYQKEVELTEENWEEYFDILVSADTYQDDDFSSYWYIPAYLMVKEQCIVISDSIELSIEGTMKVEEKKQLYPWDGTVQGYVASGEAETKSYEKNWEWELSFSQAERKVPFFACQEGYSNLTYIGENPDAIFSGEIPQEDYAQMFREYVTSVKELQVRSIKGTIRILSVPEHVWNTEEEGVRYLLVGGEGEAFRIYELTVQDDIRRYMERQTKE